MAEEEEDDQEPRVRTVKKQSEMLFVRGRCRMLKIHGDRTNAGQVIQLSLLHQQRALRSEPAIWPSSQAEDLTRARAGRRQRPTDRQYTAASIEIPERSHGEAEHQWWIPIG